MILIADKREVSSKSHDEVLHVIDNALLYDPFIAVFVTDKQFFRIDVVQQIFILKHCDGAIGLQLVWDGTPEIIWQITLMAVQIVLYQFFQIFNLNLRVCSELDIELSLFHIFHLTENCIVMAKPNVMNAAMGKSDAIVN